MASIRLHGEHWQARVRRKGHPTASRSFTTRKAAELWARQVETDIDRGTHITPTETQHVTLRELIDRYIDDVLPAMKGAPEDTIRLRALQRRPLCSYSLATLTPARIAQFRDQRLQQVSNGTVIRELAYLSSIINHARREWGVQADNPISKVRKPTNPPGRDRVLAPEEEQQLLDALQPTGRRNPWMRPLVILALETAMRRSELLALTWPDIDLSRRTATLRTSKNGEGRVVPLSSRALQTLQALPRTTHGAIIPMRYFSVAAAFSRAVERAGIAHLRFHDLRHTAITRMAEKLPNVIELSAVSGHKSLAMLKRYYHPRPEQLALKLG